MEREVSLFYKQRYVMPYGRGFCRTRAIYVKEISGSNAIAMEIFIERENNRIIDNECEGK